MKARMSKRNAAECPNRDRGSYRHMLDFASAHNFREVMNGFLSGTDSILAKADHRHPCGRSNKHEWTECELEDHLKRYPLPEYSGLDRRWWIAYKGSRPTWDLVSHIEVDGKPGLLLVEAKAHFDEMDEKNTKSPADLKNERSVANDLSIRLRLAESNLALTQMGLGEFHLSADHDYQLSNRVAYLHKIASDGVPAVLMYLGWIESPDWLTDAFPDSSAWERAVKTHFTRVGPAEFIGSKRRSKTGASFQMIVRSAAPSVLQRPKEMVTAVNIQQRAT